MAFFRKKQNNQIIESRFFQLHQILKASFFNVKNDTANIFKWINYFHQKSLSQEDQINRLKNELSLVPKTKEQIKQIVDDIYSYDAILKRIEDVEKRLNSLYKDQIPISQSDDHRFLEIQNRLMKLEQKKSGLKEKLIKKITKSSKDYVKIMIVSYIKKYEKISALQLKEMIVDEQGLCSKSSFYRILEEIEEQDDIGIIKKGKEKEYISTITKKLTKK